MLFRQVPILAIGKLGRRKRGEERTGLFCHLLDLYRFRSVVFSAMFALALNSQARLNADDQTKVEGPKQRIPDTVSTTPNVTDQLMRQWVAQLGDDSFSKRKAATDALIKAGPVAISVLEAVSNSDNREVRARAQSIKQKIVANAVKILASLGVSLTPINSHEPIWLNASRSRITDADLIQVSCLRSLVRIRLDNMPVGDEGLRHLRPLVGLTKISLRNTKVTDATINHLVGMPKLTCLNLDGCRISDEGLAAMAKLESLEEITLADTLIADAGLAHLAHLSNLRSLSLMRTGISGDGLHNLKSLGRQMAGLQLSGIGLSDEDLEPLKHFTGLQSIYLDDTDVSAAGLVHLMSLPSLRRVWLRNTDLSDDAIAHLSCFQTMELLNLSGTKVTPVGVGGLRKAPKLQLIYVPDEFTQHDVTKLRHDFQDDSHKSKINVFWQ